MQLAGHAVAVAVHIAVVGHHRGVAGVVAVGAQPPGRRAVRLLVVARHAHVDALLHGVVGGMGHASRVVGEVLFRLGQAQQEDLVSRLFGRMHRRVRRRGRRMGHVVLRIGECRGGDGALLIGAEGRIQKLAVQPRANRARRPFHVLLGARRLHRPLVRLGRVVVGHGIQHRLADEQRLAVLLGKRKPRDVLTLVAAESDRIEALLVGGLGTGIGQLGVVALGRVAHRRAFRSAPGEAKCERSGGKRQASPLVYSSHENLLVSFLEGRGGARACGLPEAR